MAPPASCNQIQKQSELSPRTIWGRVVIYLREHGYTAMHIACGDITDVEKNNDEMIIKTKEQFLIDLLEREDNKKILQDAFLSQGINKYKIEKKDKKSDLAQVDVQKLRAIFSERLIIK